MYYRNGSITSDADASQTVVGGAGNNTVQLVTTNNSTYTVLPTTLTINVLTTGTGVVFW